MIPSLTQELDRTNGWRRVGRGAMIRLALAEGMTTTQLGSGSGSPVSWWRGTATNAERAPAVWLATVRVDIWLRLTFGCSSLGTETWRRRWRRDRR